MPAICIVTGSHLCRNPRVVKEATALSAAGYEVTVLGPTFSDELAELDAELTRQADWEKQTVIDLRAERAGSFNRFRVRATRRVGMEAVCRTGWQLPYALGYGIKQTRSAARKRKADLYIGHQELGAWVAYELGRERKRVGADLEDWYSRDLLPEAQARRPLKLLARCEEYLLQHATHRTTTSHALASALAATYQSPKPTVVYNCFSWSERVRMDGATRDREDGEALSIHWFSQSIGPGRGLETLFAALEWLDKPVAIHLRGAFAPSTEGWLHRLLPKDKGHKLYLHSLVPPAELLSRVAEHDVGLALELTTPENKDLTVANKLLHYLLAGLAVVASDTAGQREIAAVAPAAVRLFRKGDAKHLSAQLNAFLHDAALLAQAKAGALQAAKEQFCWEKQAPILLDSIQNALQVRRRAG